MATVTRFLGGNGDDVRFYYDYDDVTFYMTAFRCINNTESTWYGTAMQTSNARTYSGTFTPGTTEFTIGTNAAQRMELVVTPSGTLDGVEWSLW